jgi:hypothetical protein
MAIKSGETTYHQAKRGIVQNGLVLNLDAGVDASYNGGTTWRDLSSSNRDVGIYNTIPHYKNRGGEFLFDGASDFMQTTDWQILTGNASYTYDIFFKKYSNNNSNWVSYGSASANSLNQLGIYNGTLGALQYSNDTGVSASSVTSNEWHSLVATHDGSTTKIYVDSSMVASKSTTYSFGSSNLNIGRAITGSYYANISLGYIRIYNRALTATEVTQNYNATRHRFGV